MKKHKKEQNRMKTKKKEEARSNLLIKRGRANQFSFSATKRNRRAKDSSLLSYTKGGEFPTTASGDAASSPALLPSLRRWLEGGGVSSHSFRRVGSSRFVVSGGLRAVGVDAASTNDVFRATASTASYAEEPRICVADVLRGRRL